MEEKLLGHWETDMDACENLNQRKLNDGSFGASSLYDNSLVGCLRAAGFELDPADNDGWTPLRRAKNSAMSTTKPFDFQSFAERLARKAKGKGNAFEIARLVVVRGPKDFDVDILENSLSSGVSGFIFPSAAAQASASAYWERKNAHQLDFLAAFVSWMEGRPGLFVAPDSDRALHFGDAEIMGRETLDPDGPSVKIATEWLGLPEVEKLLLDAVLAEVPVAAPTRRSAL